MENQHSELFAPSNTDRGHYEWRSFNPAIVPPLQTKINRLFSRKPVYTAGGPSGAFLSKVRKAKGEPVANTQSEIRAKLPDMLTILLGRCLHIIPLAHSW
jgi:hypothetical protein